MEHDGVKRKPLGIKAYGSIGHLPNSRLGPGDHRVPDGQGDICCRKARDKHDVIIVQEKLDGSNVAAAKIEGQIVPLVRAGYVAWTSKFVQHHHWARWVQANAERFDRLLEEGERACGEWLAQAHGTRYRLTHDPFVLFDLMRAAVRQPYNRLLERATPHGFITPHLLHRGGPLDVPDAMVLLGPFGHHGAIDPVEGLVYRVERQGEVDFLAKYVRPDKQDGIYLPELSGQPEVWNWLPDNPHPHNAG